MLPPIPHTDGMGGSGGWAICDADPIRFIGVCRRAPSRPSKSPWRTRGLFGLAACLVSFQPDSNRRPSASEADALSTELWNVGGFSTRTYYASPSVKAVGLTGFEPATPGLGNRCSNPLSYKGVCRLVAGTSQLVFRFDGIHISFSLIVMALRLPWLSPTGMMVFIARSTRPLDCPSADGPRDSTPRFLAVRRCDRAPRGIRTHNPRFKRPLL